MFNILNMKLTYIVTASSGLAALCSAEPKKEPFPPHIICGDPPLYPCGTSAAHNPPPTKDIVESVRELVSQYFTPTTTKTHTFTHEAETSTVTLHKTTTTKTRTRTSTGWETTTTWAEKRAVRAPSSSTATSTSWPAIMPLPEPTVESMTWSKRSSNPISQLKDAVLDFWHDPVPRFFRKTKRRNSNWPCPCSRKEFMDRLEFYSNCNPDMDCVDNTMPCPCDPKAPRSPRCDPELPCLDARFPCPCEWDDQPREWGYWIDTKCIDELPCRYYPRNCTRAHPENCRPLNRTWQPEDTEHPVTDEEYEDTKVKRCEKGESAEELMSTSSLSAATPSTTTPLGIYSSSSSSSEPTSHATTDLTVPFATVAPPDNSESASSSSSTSHSKTDFTIPFATPAPPTSAAMRNMPVFSLFRRSDRRKGGGCWFSILFCKRGEDPLVPKIPLENATWHHEPEDAARYVDLADDVLNSKDPDWKNVGTGPRDVAANEALEDKPNSKTPADWEDVGVGPRQTAPEDSADHQADWRSAEIEPRRLHDRAVLLYTAIIHACDIMDEPWRKAPEAHNVTRCISEMNDSFNEGLSDDVICTFDRSGSYDDCLRRLLFEQRAIWDAMHPRGDGYREKRDGDSDIEMRYSNPSDPRIDEEDDDEDHLPDLTKRHSKIIEDIDGACNAVTGHYGSEETRQCQDDLTSIFKYSKTPKQICHLSNPDPESESYSRCRERIKNELYRYKIWQTGEWDPMSEDPRNANCDVKGAPLEYYGRCGIGVDGKSVLPGETVREHNRKAGLRPSDTIMSEDDDGILKYPFQPDDRKHGGQGTNG